MVAPAEGNKLGVNPSSSVNIWLYTYQKIGIIAMNALMIEGSTNRLEYIMTKLANEHLLKPTILIIPVSKLFVSMVIISSE